jgi:hypothetical protein
MGSLVGDPIESLTPENRAGRTMEAESHSGLTGFLHHGLESKGRNTMRRFAVALGLAAGILLVAGQVHAQYRYTDDKGVTKVTQYKLDVPAPYRDAAVWIGQTGVGKPALSEEQQRAKQRDDAYRRIGIANERLVPYKKAEAEAKRAEAAAAATQGAKKAQERQDAEAAAQDRRDRLAEESVRLQRESVDLQRQQQWRGR